MPSKLLIGVFGKNALIAAIKSHLDGRKPDISTAVLIASSAFHVHKDRNQRSYFAHLAQSLVKRRSDRKHTVGILHDLLEMTDWKLSDLKKVGFSQDIIRAVDFVTRRSNELYFDFIERCGCSLNEFNSAYLAIDPKIDDLDHNMNLSREKHYLTAEQNKKQRVYLVARTYLVALKNEEFPPGTPVSEFMKMKKYTHLYDAELLLANSSSARAVDQAKIAAAVAPTT